jgi:uncharacterized protein (UPF0276 family)
MEATIAEGRRDGPGSRVPRISGAGIGLRTCHIDQVLRDLPDVPWFELLADNHLAAGGLVRAQVEAVRAHYPLALHCVDMNLAGADPLDLGYLRRVRDLRDRCGATWVSDHLCFTAVDGRNYHDLLPIPYTEEALTHVARRILMIQDFLGERLLVENVSSYLRFAESPLTEAQFLGALAREADCLLLLDVNNLYVNQVNHGDDLDTCLDALPLDRVMEIHLGGYEPKDGYLLDAHNNPVSEPVWRLYERVAGLLPDVPTLIEWDNDIPAFSVLLSEAERASRIATAVLPGGLDLGIASGAAR